MTRATRRPKNEEPGDLGDDPRLIRVSEPQFDALLSILDTPPEVPETLRREVAGRRWK